MRSKPDGRDAKRLGAEHESAATLEAAGAQYQMQKSEPVGRKIIDRNCGNGTVLPQKLDCALTDVASLAAQPPQHYKGVAVVEAVAAAVASDVAVAGFDTRCRGPARVSWTPS